MVYKSRLKANSEGLIIARRWAIGIITTILGTGMIVSEINRVRSEWPNPMIICYVALLALTGLMVWLWIWASDHELKILWNWLDPDRYKPPQSIREVAIIITIAFLLSSLFFAARHPLLYSITFTAFSLAILLFTKYLDNHVSRALLKSRKRLQNEVSKNPKDKRLKYYSKGIDVIEMYFIGRPHRLRHLMIVVGGLFATLLGSLYMQHNHIHYGVASYVIMFITIILSEFIIGYWRNSRDEHLLPIEEEIQEIERIMEDTES